MMTICFNRSNLATPDLMQDWGDKTMADVTPEPIMRIALGFMAAKHLFTASAIGLFENLAAGPATLDELVEKCGIPRRTLRISVDAMVSLGLLEREEDRYRNSPAAAAFLSGTAESDLRPALRLWDRVSYPLWVNFESAVRAGEGQRQFVASGRTSNRSSLPVSKHSRRALPRHSRRIMILASSPRAGCRRGNGIIPYRNNASLSGLQGHAV